MDESRSSKDNELYRLRREVHFYLDSIWLFSSNQRRSRGSMYSWLSTQMNLSRSETHIKYFDSNQCKQALRILKAKYKQLYGKNNISKTENRILYNKENNHNKN